MHSETGVLPKMAVSRGAHFRARPRRAHVRFAAAALADGLQIQKQKGIIKGTINKGSASFVWTVTRFAVQHHRIPRPASL